MRFEEKQARQDQERYERLYKLLSRLRDIENMAFGEVYGPECRGPEEIWRFFGHDLETVLHQAQEGQQAIKLIQAEAALKPMPTIILKTPPP